MKELSLKQTEAVSGGNIAKEIAKVASYLKSGNPLGITIHSPKLNEGEDKEMERIRNRQNRNDGSRNGYNPSQGNYRRGRGGREIEN